MLISLFLHASCIQMVTPLAVADSLPFDPPNTIGFPVINPGLLYSSIRLYSSIIQAIICEFVKTSGAGISFVGPTIWLIARTYLRLNPSNSLIDISRESQMILHFPAPYGKSTITCVRLMQIDKARTSLSVTFG